MREYQDLVRHHIKQGTLHTPVIMDAFRGVDRSDFLPPELIDLAGEDRPLPIGEGQTNSQPYTVMFMLELLQPEPGHIVLDVGCGSGWTTALLAHIVGQEGRVVGTERLENLAKFAQSNLDAYEYPAATIQHTPHDMGCAKSAPYDRILVSAAAESLPEALVDQLNDGGRMVIPIQSNLHIITKNSGGMEEKEIPGFAFVPLIT